MDVQPRFRAGEILASRDKESGRYKLSKVLYADDVVVVTRLYVNRFAELPSEVPPGLRLDLTMEELERGDIGIGWGAIAIDAEELASEEFTSVGQEPVSEEELENVAFALDPDKVEQRKGVLSRLVALLTRRP